MKSPDQEFCIFEGWKLEISTNGNTQEPEIIHFGRFVSGSEREIVGKYDLKKRKYICTTSMDAELALITANLTLAAPGKLFYDPFVGSGSFPVACSHFGALSFGSDIDGRTIRGKGKTNLLANFTQYGLTNQFGDSFVADLTNTPLRTAKVFDGILCDPPYGVREGLKVLGSRDLTKRKEPVIKDGKAHHTYVASCILRCPNTHQIQRTRLHTTEKALQLPRHPGRHSGLCSTVARGQWQTIILDADSE